jgi:hypothetical protein
MHPLTSPVREHRLVGRIEVAIGLVFIVVASSLNPVDAVVGLAFVAPVLASVLYLAAFLRVARQAVAAPAAAPTADREEPRALRRRIGRPVAVQVVVYLLLTATARAPGLLGGVALGLGVALVLTARWLERWENAHGAGLLREPRARSGSGAPGGYYVATGGKTRALPDAYDP